MRTSRILSFSFDCNKDGSLRECKIFFFVPVGLAGEGEEGLVSPPHAPFLTADQHCEEKMRKISPKKFNISYIISQPVHRPIGSIQQLDIESGCQSQLEFNICQRNRKHGK